MSGSHTTRTKILPGKSKLELSFRDKYFLQGLINERKSEQVYIPHTLTLLANVSQQINTLCRQYSFAPEPKANKNKFVMPLQDNNITSPIPCRISSVHYINEKLNCINLLPKQGQFTFHRRLTTMTSGSSL